MNFALGNFVLRDNFDLAVNLDINAEFFLRQIADMAHSGFDLITGA